MLTKLTLYTAMLTAFSPFASAGIDFDGGKNTAISAETLRTNADLPAPRPEAGGTAVKEWTVMVYINGKNNLETYALRDMNEMEQIGSTDKLNIVTEIGRITGYDTSDGDWLGVRRYLVQKDTDTAAITSPVAQDLGRHDMGDYQSVIDFGRWAKQNYPARHYMLIIWNHGSGWVRSAAPAARGISYDDETKNHINTPQMAAILNEIGGVDVYASDACLMQMVEVDYQLKNYAQYIAGSEETEPANGYAYNAMLGALAANPAMTAEELGRQAVNTYADYYQGKNKGATHSLVRTAALDGFLKLSDEFVAAMIASRDAPVIRRAMITEETYAAEDNKDLFQVLGHIVKETRDPAVAQKAGALQDYIVKDLVVLNRFVTDRYAYSHGIAVYLPRFGISADYAGLDWARDSRWDNLINWYTNGELTR
ncbi:MAG: clostripain-related cysteine peptidase [Elusimicrobia bacterium]|nr:clostripain-related cysteine peptidase [Elusimicrobiota bacterium]